MGFSIHPTAIVHPQARIGEGSTIGAFSVIEAEVTIGERANIASHVVIHSHTHIGSGANISSFAVLGGAPQHTRYKGEPTTLEIGNDVTIRESVTCNRGTEFGHGKTVIKDRVMLMAYCHVAHDCVVGTDVIMANAVQLAGHVEVGDFVGIGGVSAVTQFCRVGSHSFLGGGSLLRKDLPPYVIGKGNDFEVQAINLVGLERRGFSPESLKRLRKVFKIFYLQNLTVSQAIEKIVVEVGREPEVDFFLKFLEGSKNGILR